MPLLILIAVGFRRSLDVPVLFDDHDETLSTHTIPEATAMTRITLNILDVTPLRAVVLATVLLLGFTPQSSALSLQVVTEFNANAWEAMAIVADGEIELGDSDKLELFLQNNPDPGRVVFNSPGGNLVEGMKIGNILRARGLTAEVGRLKGGLEAPEFEPGVCASACAIAFLGGRERYLLGSVLGFHQFYENLNFEELISNLETRTDVSGQAQLISSLLSLYIENLGDIDHRILLLAASTPPNEMYWVSDQTAIDLGIQTSADPWTEIWLEPYKGGLIAATRRERSLDGYNGRGPYDTVGQVTFFCRSGKPRIMLSSAHLMFLLNDENWTRVTVTIEENDDTQTEHDISQSITLRGTEERGWTEIEIPISVTQEMINSKSFHIFIGFPRVVGGPQQVSLVPNQMDKEKIRVAFRYCI